MPEQHQTSLCRSSRALLLGLREETPLQQPQSCLLCGWSLLQLVFQCHHLASLLWNQSKRSICSCLVSSFFLSMSSGGRSPECSPSSASASSCKHDSLTKVSEVIDSFKLIPSLDGRIIIEQLVPEDVGILHLLELSCCHSSV